jgi:hypothetical protein
LEKEKAKAAKFKGWLEKMTEQKSALETELSEVLCVICVCVGGGGREGRFGCGACACACG